MNMPDVKVESQNASIRNDEGSASLVKSVKAQIASKWLNHLPRSEVRTASEADRVFRFRMLVLVTHYFSLNFTHHKTKFFSQHHALL